MSQHTAEQALLSSYLLDSTLASVDDLNVRLVEPASYDDVFQLAEQHGLTVYDAAYLSVAVQEGIPLATLDQKLARAAEALGVELFGS